LLVIIGFVAGIFIAFIPFVVPEVALKLDPIICPGNEIVDIHTEPARDGGTSFSFVCVNDAGRVSEPNFVIYLILFTAWIWVPFIPFVLLMLSGGFPRGRSTLVTLDVGNIAGRPATFTSSNVSMGGMSGSANTTLKEKLQQLEEARNAGLLTEDQFERARQSVLDNLTES
jgi:hypothetical protein